MCSVVLCLCAHAFVFQEQMPKSPEGESKAEPKLQFAVVECVLFTFHQMIQQVSTVFFPSLSDKMVKAYESKSVPCITINF